MFSSRNYYDRESFMWGVRAFFLDFIPGAVSVVVGLVVVISAVVVALVWIFARPECSARADKMAIQAEWTFHTGCMVNLKGQWLPWSEVVPVERNGKIEFAPKSSK